MRNRWIVRGLLGTVIALAPGVVGAQTLPTAPTSPRPPQQTAATTHATSTTSTAGAFDRLSPGNQQIARALFRAQTTSAPSGSATTPLTLDQIAALKQSGKGWGGVFKSMQSQGLVQEKNLGQVVSKFRHQQRGITPGPTATTGHRGTPAAGPSTTSLGASSARGRGADQGAGGASQGSAVSSGAGGSHGLGQGSGTGSGRGPTGQVGGGRGRP